MNLVMKSLVISLTVLASISPLAESFGSGLVPSGGWKREYDNVEKTIRAIDDLIQKRPRKDEPLLRDIREKMHNCDAGSPLCQYQEAKQIGEWLDIVDQKRKLSFNSSKTVFELIKGWLTNRIAQCTELFADKYLDQSNLITSVVRIGRQKLYHHIQIKLDPLNFWFRFFQVYASKGEGRCLAGTSFIKFGIVEKARKLFNKLYEERIAKPCEIVRDMADATSFGEAVKSVSAVPDNYKMHIREFALAKEGCRAAESEGMESIKNKTLESFKEAARLDLLE